MLHTSSPAASSAVYLDCTLVPNFFFQENEILWNISKSPSVALLYWSWSIQKIKLSLVRLEKQNHNKAKAFPLLEKERMSGIPGKKRFPDSWPVRLFCFGRTSSEQVLLWLLKGFISKSIRRKQPHGKVIKLWNKGIKYSPLGLWNCAPPALKAGLLVKALSSFFTCDL